MQGYFVWQKFYVFALFWNPSVGAKGARSMSCAYGPV